MAGIGNRDSRRAPLDKMSGSAGACPYVKIVNMYAIASRNPLMGKLANAVFPLFDKGDYKNLNKSPAQERLKFASSFVDSGKKRNGPFFHPGRFL